MVMPQTVNLSDVGSNPTPCACFKYELDAQVGF